MSAGEARPLLRRFLLRFLDYFVKMWFAWECTIFTRPVPVRFMRLAAPLWVFILGIFSPTS